MKEIKPYDAVCQITENSDLRQLVFSYEAILTEMRTHARADRTIKEWVSRLDFARDEFVRATPSAGTS